MTDEMIIDIRALTMRYGGGEEVLTGIDLKVPRGAVYGLLGRNGAGKTTLLRCLMGLFRPTGGSIRLFGEPAQPMTLETKQRIGYLSQDQRLFDWMTVLELMDFLRPHYPTWDAAYAEELRDQLALPARIPVGNFSRGEQQKVGLLLALAPRPDLLILDEPAANLDTVHRREFLTSVLDLLTRDGMTVLFSSHILPDVERIADWIGILSHGTLMLAAPLEELKESVKRLRIYFQGDVPETVDVPGAVRVRKRGREFLVTVHDYTPAIEAGIRSRYGAGVEVQSIDLEDLFIEYVS